MYVLTMPSARDFFPAHRTLSGARDAARTCRGCDLWQRATQTVFGEGLRRARLMLVGEMPGDREDIAGRPFVGPAGRVLDDALTVAGIDRDDAWVTNVVKHFRWTPRGKRRLHKKPDSRQIGACLPWLELELQLVRPAVLVCLGATATRALLGPGVQVTRERGRFIPSHWAPHVTATVHPSSLLRIGDREARHEAMARFIADLVPVARLLRGQGRRRVG
jgi:DNA polymerase